MIYAQPQPAGPSGPAPGGKKIGGRPMWHWLVLGGIALVGLLLVSLVGLIVLLNLLGRGNPQDTLDDFYSSMENSDCELYMDSTTEEFRRALEITSCTAFDQTLGTVSAVDYTVNDRVNRQGYAIFEVTENIVNADGGKEEVRLRYFILRTDGQWDLDGIQLVDEDTEPIE